MNRKKHLLPLILGLAGVFAIATAFGTGDEPQDEPEDDGVVLGEEDLAERGEILRNQFRRMTPGDEPLVQDIGTWPAAWEEFGTNWDSAAADREYGAWVVPVELTQENGATVMKDGEGNELWRGTTDFARPESSDVVLTGGLVAEEDWAVYEAVRGAVEEMTAEASRVDIPVPMRSHPTNGLRFTSCAWTTDDSFHVDLAYEVDTNVDLFVYAVAYTSALVVATWTNDENVAVTDTNTVWYSVGEPFNGRDSTWEYLDTVAIDNGEAEYEDSGFPAGLGRLRYYAAAVARDSDGDGLSDGEEAFVLHTAPENDDSDGDGLGDGDEINVYGTDPFNPDTDGDGWTDGEEVHEEQTDPLDRLSATRLARGVLVHAVKYSGDATNQWVQLHCSGPRPVDLSGFRLQTAGTSWQTVAILPPDTWIIPGHFFLIGDEGVPSADLSAVLGLAGSYPDQPTAGVRLMAPAGSTNDPVDTMFYGTHVPFNEQGLDTTGWSSDTTNLWAAAMWYLERKHLGLDSDRDSDWRYAADGNICNSTVIVDSDCDGLSDEEEYMAGCNPLNPDMDSDGLLDGFELNEGLDPLDADSDNNGTPDGDETDPETQQPYSTKQRADGLTLAMEGPMGWEPGDDLGWGGSVTNTITDLDGFAVWGTIWEGGAINEAYNVSVTGASDSWQWTLTPSYGHTMTLVFAVPNGTNAIQVIVTDSSTNSGVTDPDEQGADINASFKALRLNIEIDGIGEGEEEQPGAFLANGLVHTNTPRTECHLAATEIPFFTTLFIPGQLSLQWNNDLVHVYNQQEDGTLLSSVTASLGVFHGTNIWLEGIFPTNTLMAWNWNALTHGQDVAQLNIESLELYPTNIFGCPRCLNTFDVHLTNSVWYGGLSWSISPNNLTDGATITPGGDYATVCPGQMGAIYAVRVASSNNPNCFAEASLTVCVPGSIIQTGNYYIDEAMGSHKHVYHQFSPTPATAEAGRHFCFVQFLKGFMRNTNGYMHVNLYGNVVEFNLPTWQIDSSDNDPAFSSPPHYAHDTCASNTYFVMDSPQPLQWSLGMQCNVEFRTGIYCALQTPLTGANLQPALGIPFDEATWEYQATAVADSPTGLTFTHP